MRKQPIERALPIVASALGRKFGVKVAIGGCDAATDGKVIHLPASAAEEDPDVIWGYLAHEAAHVRYTDFGPFKLATDRPLRKAILNVLEDVRIEKALAGPFPGTRRTIAKTLARMKAQGELAFNENAKPPALLHDYLLLRLRSEVLGQKVLAGEAERAELALRETFPPGLVTRLHGLMSEVPELQSTREALALTDRILRMVKEELEKQDQDGAQQNDSGCQNGQGQGGAGNLPGSSGQGDSSAVSGQGGDENATGQANGADSPENKADPSGSRGRDSGKGEGQGGDAGLGGGKLTFQDLERCSEEDFRDPFRTIRERLEANARDSEWVLPLTVELPGHPDPCLVADVRRETAKLRAALQGIVQASRRERAWYRDHGRVLAPRRLAATAVGDYRVFRYQLEKRMPNTVIHLLIDRSGSMRQRIYTATRAALALALALEGIPGVNLGISAFPGEQENEVFDLLPHGKRVESVASNFRIGAFGGTPMHMAIWHAAASVLACREPRKVITVLTDGEPGNVPATVDVIGRCLQSGIEVCGIGIGVFVEHLFPVSSKINDISELSPGMFEMGRRILVAA